MIRPLRKNEINAFIDFGESIYANDPLYVPYLHYELKRSLKRLVFGTRRYQALCSFDEAGRMNGRILLTVGKNKQLASEHCGYFSHFEVVNDRRVFDELMNAAIVWLRTQGAEYMLGSFFPHDPDARRGILVQGFDFGPMLFAAHNPPYYPALFEAYGFQKLTDALEYEYAEKEETIRKIRETAEKSLAENDFHIDRLDVRHLDRDLEDVHKIMEAASTQINFEAVLPLAEIKKMARQWRLFIDPDYAFLARRNSDNEPIGFTLSVPDYNEVIRAMRGRTDLGGIVTFLTARRRIRGLRAVLQYIIPAYQHKGVSKALYYETKKAVDKNHAEKTLALLVPESRSCGSNGRGTQGQQRT